MLLSKHFVFVHFPKTGGSFVRRVIRQFAPPAWEVQVIADHPTIAEIPPAYRGLPVFGFVRNPWDWYVSWYHYLLERGDNEFFNRVSQGGARGFRETLLAVLETDFVRDSGLGGWSWYIFHTFGRDLAAVRLGRFENLRADLLTALESMVAIPAPLRKAIHAQPSINVGRHEAYDRYYDEELREIVARKDQALIEAFGYRF